MKVLEFATLCQWCQAAPNERHATECPEYRDDFEDVQFCDRCGQSYVTCCGCDEEIDR